MWEKSTRLYNSFTIQYITFCNVHGVVVYNDTSVVACPRQRTPARERTSSRLEVELAGVMDRHGLLVPRNGVVHRVGSTTYHDVMLSWSAAQQWAMRFIVENLFDRAPPCVDNGLEANTDAPTYRLAGRTVALSIECSR